MASEQKGLAKETSESEWEKSAILDGAGSPRLQGGLENRGPTQHAGHPHNRNLHQRLPTVLLTLLLTS